MSLIANYLSVIVLKKYVTVKYNIGNSKERIMLKGG